MFTSEPAYSTLTGPDPVAEADAAGLLDELAVLGAAADEEDDELLLLLQAAAASDRHVMPSRAAANRLFDDLKGSIPRR